MMYEVARGTHQASEHTDRHISTSKSHVKKDTFTGKSHYDKQNTPYPQVQTQILQQQKLDSSG